ncbi:hypothetical protein BH24CHL6_BH24CHL6_13710 [soil metagenome]
MTRPTGAWSGSCPVAASSRASLAELAAWPAIMAPRRLPELLAPSLAGELPREAIDTGV